MFGLVSQVKAVKRRSRSLLQLNLELAKLEAKQKATALGIAAGLGIAAAVLLVYAVGFLFAAAAAGIAETLPLWAALLIVAGVLILVAAIVVLVAVRFAKKISPPKPAQAIEEAERTIETVHGHV